MKISCALIIGVALIPSAAMAEVTVGVSLASATQNDGSQTVLARSVSAGISVTRRVTLEAGLESLTTGSDCTACFEGRAISANVKYLLGSSKRLRPYLLAGVANETYRSDSGWYYPDPATFLRWETGLGAQLNVAGQLRLFADLRFGTRSSVDQASDQPVIAAQQTDPVPLLYLPPAVEAGAGFHAFRVGASVAF